MTLSSSPLLFYFPRREGRPLTYGCRITPFHPLTWRFRLTRRGDVSSSARARWDFFTTERQSPEFVILSLSKDLKNRFFDCTLRVPLRMTRQSDPPVVQVGISSPQQQKTASTAETVFFLSASCFKQRLNKNPCRKGISTAKRTFFIHRTHSYHVLHQLVKH